MTKYTLGLAALALFVAPASAFCNTSSPYAAPVRTQAPAPQRELMRWERANLAYAGLGDVPQAVAPAVPVQGAPQLPAPVQNDRVWRPLPNLTWQLQFASTLDARVEADVYKIDLFDNGPEAVEALHQNGKKVVCYLNAGAWENWRPDAKRFPAAVMGRGYDGWPGERWLDIRRIDVLAPIMLARLDLCRDKGFDGVMLDNVNSFTNRTGFSLTAADQLRFNIWLANEARSRGLAVGMNNNPEQARQLAPYFDWVVAESCLTEGWCGTLRPFIEQGKAVVVIEYAQHAARLDALCRQASALQVSLTMKRRELDAYRMDCRSVATRAGM
jgi:hypothetical protein